MHRPRSVQERPPAHVSPPATGHDAGAGHAAHWVATAPYIPARPPNTALTNWSRWPHPRQADPALLLERRDAPPTPLPALGCGHCRPKTGGRSMPPTDCGGARRVLHHAKPQALHLFRTARSSRLPAPASRARAAQCTLMKPPRTRRRLPPTTLLAACRRLHDHGGAWTATARGMPVGAGATGTRAAGPSWARHK